MPVEVEVAEVVVLELALVDAFMEAATAAAAEDFEPLEDPEDSPELEEEDDEEDDEDEAVPEKMSFCVVNLGSGGGVDVFLAAEKVGATGSVIGLDMSDVRR